jgi:hypothetical protein
MRTFWSDVYAHVPDATRRKLDPKADLCKFLGYSENRKAYILWSLSKKKRIFSRDAKVDESRILKIDPVKSVVPKKTVSFAPSSSVFIPFDEPVPLPVDEVLNANPNEAPVIPLEEPVPLDNEDVFLDAPDNFLNHEPADDLVHVEEQLGVPLAVIAPEEPAPASLRRSTRIRSVPRPYWDTALASVVQEPKSDPRNFREAQSRSDWPAWKISMDEEMDAQLKCNTWELVPLPAGKNLIDCRWVYKTKLKADGSLDRHKSRLCAKGYTQIHGVDFEETFAPVVKFPSMRVLLSIAASRDMELHQMDVKCAFLNGVLDEEIYMRPPEGYQVPDNLVCRLKKAIYGLKQSPRVWFKTIDTYLKSLGFNPCPNDLCVYVRWLDNKLAFISLYVDDLIIASDCPHDLANLKRSLNSRFEMKDLGELEYCLNFQIHRDRKRKLIHINQEKYTRDLLSCFDMTMCKPVDTPLLPNPYLSNTPNEDFEVSQTEYRKAVGKLVYLMKGTRPDIAAAFCFVSRHVENPQQHHWVAVKRILRYLQGTLTHGLTYGQDSSIDFTLNSEFLSTIDTSSEQIVYGFVDSDWGSDPTDRRSLGGYVFKLNGAPVTWHSKKQPTVALSSTEAEYMAATSTIQDSIWLAALLRDLGFPQTRPIPIYEDNQGCISLIKNATDHARTKHIDIKYHFIRERVENKEVKFMWLPSPDNQADILTKGFNPIPFKRLRSFLGLGHLSIEGGCKDPNIICPSISKD